MDIKEIQNLIKFVAKSGANEVKLEMEDIKLTIKTGAGKTETTIVQAAPMHNMQQPAAAAPVAQPTAQEAATEASAKEDAKYVNYKIANNWYLL
jgi:hypothetical protein